MPKKKQTKKTVKKKKEPQETVGYYWDGIKNTIIKKPETYYQYNGHRATAQSSIDRKSKAGL